MKETTKWVSLMVTVISLSLGAFFALFEWEPNKPFNCEYHSIASFMPGRVLVCELFRKRW